VIEDALRAILSADPAVLAGAVGGIRTPPLPQITNPEAQLPQVLIFRVAGGEGLSQDGPAPASVRFQLDVWAKDYRVARELARNVRTALNGFPRQGQTGVIGGEAIQLVKVVDGSDGSDYDDSVKLHRSTADYQVEVAAESTAA
jgi:Protein of unknown function (DUF3168)